MQKTFARESLDEMKKKPLPTDLEILDWIYEKYSDEFADSPAHSSDVRVGPYILIDVQAVSTALGVHPDIVFGRLYYRFEREYGYRDDKGASVHFFQLASDLKKPPVGERTYLIHFPLMASVLAELRADDAKHQKDTTQTQWSLGLSIIAIVVSAVTAIFSK